MERAATPATITAVLEEAARARPDRPCLVTAEGALTFAGLWGAVRGVAAHLAASGLRAGDRVFLLQPNGRSFVTGFLGTVAAGGCAVALDPRMRAAAFSALLDECYPRVLIADRRGLERLAPALEARIEPPACLVVTGAPPPGSEIFRRPARGLEEIVGDPSAAGFVPPAAAPDAIVSISYTSGSTGAPKGVLHSHRSWLAGARFTVQHFGLDARSAMLVPLPLHHAYALRHVLAYLLAGGRTIVTDGLIEGLERLDADRPDGLLLVPDTAAMLVRDFRPVAARSAPFVRLVSIGTAAIGDDLLDDLRALFPGAALHLPYGLTEARVGFLRLEDGASCRRLSAIAPGLEVRVVDEKGRAVAPGGTGEIVIRGEGLMVGYFGAGDRDLALLLSRGFHTGDMGLVTGDGAIALVGRLDDLIKVGGRKVVPQEIEAVLNLHPAVAESAVFGVPDGAGGTLRLEAMVVARGPCPRAEELALHCKEHLDAWKVPAVFAFAEALPRTAGGKIARQPPEKGAPR